MTQARIQSPAEKLASRLVRVYDGTAARPLCIDIVPLMTTNVPVYEFCPDCGCSHPVEANCVS